MAPSSTSSSSLDRLNSIASHISPAMSTISSFPADFVPQAPEDALFGLARAYKADTSSNKVDLVSQIPTRGVCDPSRKSLPRPHTSFPPNTNAFFPQGIGAYRDNNAKPWVLPVVKKVTSFFSSSSVHDVHALPRWLCAASVRACATTHRPPRSLPSCQTASVRLQHATGQAFPSFPSCAPSPLLNMRCHPRMPSSPPS